MNENFAVQLFEGKKVRIVWDVEQEKYYFSVTDIVQVLTDSVNPRDYIKKMLRRDPELKSKWGQFVPLLKCWTQFSWCRIHVEAFISPNTLSHNTFIKTINSKRYKF